MANEFIARKGLIALDDTQVTGSISVSSTASLTGLQYPLTDGLDRQVMKTDGNGNLSFGYAENVEISVKNVSGGSIPKGTPCYITASGTSGNVAGIIPADASDISTMPASVIAGETLADGAEGVGLINGFIQGVDTSAFTSGDTVYVAVGGGYTNVKPTGSGVYIQKLGNIEKVASPNGSGVINGPGYYNDLPNWEAGKVMVGTDTYPVTSSVITLDESNTKLTIEGSGSTIFEVVGSEGQLFSITDSLSGSLFAVSDVSGLPILEVFSDDTVKIGTFNNEAIIVNGSTSIITGSFTGSFVGDGSGLTGIPTADGVISSSAQIATEISGAFTSTSASIAADIATNVSDISTNTSNISSLTSATSSYITSLPSGVVSSSAQVNLGSATGTIDISTQTNLAVGNGITLTGDTLTVTAGVGLTQTAGGLTFDAAGGTVTTNNADVDHILINDGGTFKRITKGNINVGDFNNNAGYLTSVPAGTISSSAQVDHDQTANFSADEHFTQANITTVGTVTSGNVTAILPSGVVSSSAQVTITESQISDLTHYTDSDVKTKLNTENVVSGSASQVRTFLNVEDGADVTDTANVTAAGALMDSEVDADIKTLSLPANTTISTFGASLIDDANNTTARATLGLGSIATAAAGDYVSINGDTLEGTLDLDTNDIINAGSVQATTISGSTFVSDGVTIVSIPDVQTVKLGQSAGGSGPMKTSIVSNNVQYGLFSSAGIELTGSVSISDTLSIPGFANVSASLAAAVAGGDDLGNHTATQNLNMGGYSITNALNITASGNISASGDLYSTRLNLPQAAGSGIVFGEQAGDSGFIYDDGNKLWLGYNDSDIISIHDADGDNVQITGNLTVSSAITGSDIKIDGWMSVSASLASARAGSVTINNNTDNYIVTATGTTGTLSGESNFQINSGELSVGVNGYITFTPGDGGRKSGIHYDADADFETTSTLFMGTTVRVGAPLSTTAGKLYNLSGSWAEADASSVSTSTGFLGVALQTDTTNTFLKEGMYNLLSSQVGGTYSAGAPLYISETNGAVTFTPPTTSGAIVRIIGHAIDSYTSGTTWYKIYLKPSNDWLELE